ncbi:MAG: IS110 family transposase, partial [Actinomycetota bacterium]
MLGVGIDWSEEYHLVALGRPGDGVIEIARVEHHPKAVDALITKVAELEPDPAEVRVVIETRHGMLVERLIDAGYVVVPVNPDLVARRRGPAKKKDDAEDARIVCLIALDRFERLRPLIPHGDIAGELRSIARDDARATKDERRLL